jgi:quercetin dioxygenase-like cupin family protein
MKTLLTRVAGAPLALWVALAIATPGTAVQGQPLARVTVQDAVDMTLKGPFDTFIQKVTIGPGGDTGWHSHPGPHVIAVTEGILTVYAADDASCTPHRYQAGTGLYSRGAGDVRNERNEGAVSLVLYVTYFIPPGSTPRTDATAKPGNCTARGF